MRRLALICLLLALAAPAAAQPPRCRLMLEGFDTKGMDPAMSRLCRTPGLKCRELLAYGPDEIVMALDCPRGPAMLRHLVSEALAASGHKDLYLEAREDRLLVMPLDQAPEHHDHPTQDPHPEGKKP